MAPSTTSALHPIVIPPVQLPPYFTTLGTGLLHATHGRESATTLRALLLSNPPLLENKGKPKPWWRAQCLLYGIDAPEKRTVQELRTSLELALLKGELVIPAALVELEHRENGKFRKLNAQVREATGVSGEKKSIAPPKKTVGDAKAKKPAKDPLKVVKGTTKVTKSQPAKKVAAPKHDPVTVNLTINLAAPAKAKAAGKKTKPETAAAKPPPKPRVKKETENSKVGASDPTYFGSAIQNAEPGKSKAAPKMRRGGAKLGNKPVPVKKDPDGPKPKQTARCSSRGGPGGLGKGGSRVKKEAPVWPKQEDTGSPVDYDSDYYLYGSSDYADQDDEGRDNGRGDYSDQDDEGRDNGRGDYSDQDDEDGY